MNKQLYARQQGAALIMVLLVMTLVSILAVNSSDYSRYNSARVLNQFDFEQAYWYALGAEELAREVLAQDAKAKTTHLNQDWATRDAILPVDGGSLEGSIKDRNNCFNVNALANAPLSSGSLPNAHLQFNALMNTLEVPPDIGDKLREGIRDWTDTDFTPTGFQGVEFGFSTENQLAYQPPNAPMFDISELWRITDLPADTVRPLLPYLCVLPDSQALSINVNTLDTQHSVLLVGILQNRLTVPEAQEILLQRPTNGFATLEEFWNLPQLKEKAIAAKDKASITLKSSHFRTDIVVTYQNARRVQHAWFKIENQSVRTLARQYGERL